jgi:hypothetical protein
MPIITESSPTQAAGHYYGSGRGGAGNYRRLATATLPAPPTTTLPAPPTTLPPPSATSSSSSHYFSGRGGAGNARDSSKRAAFSFGEELERDRVFHSNQPPVYSVGRGGAGNIVPSDATATRSHYTAASAVPTPRASTSSDGVGSIRSSADRVLNRLSKIRSSGGN